MKIGSRRQRFVISGCVMAFTLALELAACGGSSGTYTTAGGMAGGGLTPISLGGGGGGGAGGAGGGGGGTGGLYTIGGTLNAASGSIASGLQLALDTTFVGSFPPASGASFSWYFGSQVANGATYTVTVVASPASQPCSIKAGTGTGTVAASNVTSVVVNC